MENFIELRDVWAADAKRSRELAKGHSERSYEHVRYITKAATLENCVYLLNLAIATKP